MLWLTQFFRWLLPYTCILCRMPAKRAQDICQACLASLPTYPGGCKHCASIIPYSDEKLICGVCQRKPPPFDETHALLVYRQPVTKMILDLKFQHALMNARLLGELLAEQIQRQWYAQQRLPEVIIPMPLHAKRLRERGFNQALEIARPVSKMLKIPLAHHICRRVKHTAAQATLSADLRQKNMRNAFWVAPDFAPRHVAVLDDVITTGSTMMEFCRLLKKQGIEKIDVWCCARPERIVAKKHSTLSTTLSGLY